MQKLVDADLGYMVWRKEQFQHIGKKPWKKLVDAGRAVASRASDLGRVTVPRFRSAFRPQTPNPRQLPPFYISVLRIFIISRALEGGS